MISHIDRFKQIMANEGVRQAISSSIEYIIDDIYEKSGIRDFIRGQLVISPATISHTLYVKMYKPVLDAKIGKGIDIMSQDWDNLIILDAYRADYFREYSSLDGELSTVVSKGNWSLEFIIENFQGREFHDTVVVTANENYQLYSKIDESTFHTLINVGEAENRMERMKKVTEAALDAAEKYPNKRLLIHYMQPHVPHLGETANGVRDDYWDDSFPGMFELYRRGIIAKETLERSYLDTIRIVESEIQNLLENLEGKTVVSSDHGENLGEVQHGMRQTGHGNPTPECRYVPWLELDYDERKEVSEDPPIGFDTVDEQAVQERLAALGYK